MKRKWLFLSVTSVQVCFCLVIASIHMISSFRYNAYAFRTDPIFTILIFLAILTVAAFPFYCIIFYQAKYPDGEITTKYHVAYRILMAFYFIASIGMLGISALVLGELVEGRHGYQRDFWDFALNITAIIFTVSMLYLMTALTALRALIKKNHLLKQAENIDLLGSTHISTAEYL